jgi:hypothetical protein
MPDPADTNQKRPWFGNAVSGTRPPLDPLAVVFVFGFFALTAGFFFITPPDGNAEVLNLIVGAVIGIIGTIASYRWGSSDGSKRSGDALRDIASEKGEPK